MSMQLTKVSLQGDRVQYMQQLLQILSSYSSVLGSAEEDPDCMGGGFVVLF